MEYITANPIRMVAGSKMYKNICAPLTLRFDDEDSFLLSIKGIVTKVLSQAKIELIGLTLFWLKYTAVVLTTAIKAKSESVLPYRATDVAATILADNHINPVADFHFLPKSATQKPMRAATYSRTLIPILCL